MILRINLYESVKFADGGGNIAQFNQTVRQVVMGILMVGVEGKGLAKERDGLSKVVFSFHRIHGSVLLGPELLSCCFVHLHSSRYRLTGSCGGRWKRLGDRFALCDVPNLI